MFKKALASLLLLLTGSLALAQNVNFSTLNYATLPLSGSEQIVIMQNGQPVRVTISNIPLTSSVPTVILTGNNTYTGNNVFDGTTTFNGPVILNNSLNATNQDIIDPILVNPIIEGTVTGTYTIAGAVTINNATLNGVFGGTYTLGGNITINNPIVAGGTLTNVNANTQINSDTSTLIATDQFVHNLVNASGVASFNGRIGVVVPTTGDYTCSQVTSCPTSYVSSFNSRTGAVAPTSGDYTVGQVTNAVSLVTADQTISGGANFTAQNQSAGNITVDCGSRPGQYIPNTGAFTITAPSSDGYCLFDVENGSGAGAVSVSGFSPNSIGGVALDTTNGHIFRMFISRNHGHASISATALQ